MKWKITLSLWAIVLIVPVARADDHVINLYAWSEYIPQEVLDGFTKETGVSVNYGTYDSNEKLLQSIRPNMIWFSPQTTWFKR